MANDTASDIADERTPLLNDSNILSSDLDTIVPPTTDTGLSLGPDVNLNQLSTTSKADEEQASKYLSGISTVRFWLTFGVILFVYFVAMFDSTLMASSHPVITSYFNASNAASWLSTSFLLTSTSTQPLFARISDTVGRKPLWLFSLFMFAATTAWCATAQSIGSFIAARAACGLGAGGVLAMASCSVGSEM